MKTSEVYAVDLKEKRERADLTQAALAAKIGFTREQVSAVENRRSPFSMRMAVECVRILGPLLADQGGEHFIISDNGDGSRLRHIPNDEELNDLDAAEHISNVRSQAADVIEVANRLERRWLAIRNGCPSGEDDFADYYAEAYELKWAVDGVIEDGETERPELVKRGRHIALQRRPGYLKEGDDVEPAA